MIGLDADDLTAILLSLKVAVVAMVVTAPLAFAVAHLLARPGLRGRALIEAFVFLPLVMPPVATGYGLLLLLGKRGLIGAPLESVGLGIAFRWTGAALAGALMAFPLMVRPMRLALEAIDNEALEAARTLGAGALTRLLRVTLPLAAPGLLAGMTLGFAKALGEFGATITFAAAIPGQTLTLPTDIYQATQTPGSETRAAALCLCAAGLALLATVASELVGARIRRPAGDPSSRAGAGEGSPPRVR